jgi:cyclin-dependent kinase regulatory subunit CKS1
MAVRAIHDLRGRIVYSPVYSDDDYDFRHVTLPLDMLAFVPDRLLSEPEWRELSITQRPGWVHYMVYSYEPHILLFRRVKEASAPPPAAGTGATDAAANHHRQQHHQQLQLEQQQQRQQQQEQAMMQQQLLMQRQMQFQRQQQQFQ